MVDVVPIKVRIGLRPNGEADHPDWLTLPLAATGRDRKERELLVRAQQVRSWVYDKTSGHDDDTLDSPRGMQWGMMLVTQLFADQAVATFPTLVTVLTEAEAQDFWDNKAHAHVPEFRRDVEQLQALKSERDLRVALGQNVAALDASIVKALDPDDPEPGLKRDRTKTWALAKTAMGIRVAVKVSL